MTFFEIFSDSTPFWEILIFLQILFCTKIILKKFNVTEDAQPVFKILLMEYGISLFLHFLAFILVFIFYSNIYFTAFVNPIFVVIIVYVCFHISHKLNSRFIATHSANPIENKPCPLKLLSALSTPLVFLLPAMNLNRILFRMDGWAYILLKAPPFWILIFLQISICTAIILKKFKVTKDTHPVFKILLIECGISLSLHFLASILLLAFNVFLSFTPFDHIIGESIYMHPVVFISALITVCMCFRASHKLNLRFVAPHLADSLENKSRLIKWLTVFSTPFLFLLPIEILHFFLILIYGLQF